MAPQSQDLRLQVDNYDPAPKTTEIKPSRKVFVYGTLKKGFGNYKALQVEENSAFLGEAEIDGIMFHLGNFPAISLAEPFQKIKGEIYEVNDKLLARMDQLESHPDWYLRTLVHIPNHGPVWTYVFPHKFAEKQTKVVQTGNWEGSNTPSCQWLGFGKGIMVGSWSLKSVEENTIRVADGEIFTLTKDLTADTYVLKHRPSGQRCGTYKKLGYYHSEVRSPTSPLSNTEKPRLRLPAIARPSTAAPVAEIKSLGKPTGAYTAVPASSVGGILGKHHERCQCPRCVPPKSESEREAERMIKEGKRASAMGITIKVA